MKVQATDQGSAKQDGGRGATFTGPNAVLLRKEAVVDHYDRLAPEREAWTRRNSFFHNEDLRYLRFLVPEGLRVLDVGCGTGDLLARLKPSKGVGVDFSARMIDQARKAHPECIFVLGDAEDPEVLKSVGGPFDIIFLSDTVGDLEDVEATLRNLHPVCTPDTRVIVVYYSFLWAPVLKLGEKLGMKAPSLPQNWLRTVDIGNLLTLADFQLIKREWRQLMPLRLLGLGRLVNRFVATLPLLRRFCLRNYVVARPRPPIDSPPLSVTVLIPCRNERGNIEAAVKRVPRFAEDMEFFFVEGHSQDGTLEEIERVIEAYPELDIKVTVQDGKGKGDAVRKGFDMARGDVLMILDADLTMPPEDLPKFYEALKSGKGEFINGSRLVYPMQEQAMRFLNLLANHTFSLIFTFLLNQRFTDTLCGTKVLRASHYRRIAENRSYFGDFDPFGDFDLIFGAAKLNLKTVEVPIRYDARSYGETQISRFRHGLLLLRMVVFAWRKLKAF